MTADGFDFECVPLPASALILFGIITDPNLFQIDPEKPGTIYILRDRSEARTFEVLRLDRAHLAIAPGGALGGRALPQWRRNVSLRKAVAVSRSRRRLGQFT